MIAEEINKNTPLKSQIPNCPQSAREKNVDRNFRNEVSKRYT
jgi:hypothetical protein